MKFLPNVIHYRVGGRAGHSTSVSPFDALDSKAVSLVDEPTVIFGTPSEARLTISHSNGLSRSDTPWWACSAPTVKEWVRRLKMSPSWVAWNCPEVSRQGVATLPAWDDSSVMAELAQTQTLLRHMVFIREDRLFPVERVKVRNLGGVLGIEFSNELLRRPNQIIKDPRPYPRHRWAGDCVAYSCALRIVDKAGEPGAGLL